MRKYRLKSSKQVNPSVGTPGILMGSDPTLPHELDEGRSSLSEFQSGTYTIPYVTEETGRGERSTMDIYSRLLKDRIIFIGTEITNDVANVVVAQLLFLKTDGIKDIHIYLNSPGGAILPGLAIYDTMKSIGCPINTYCIGYAASPASLILAGGTPGKRFVLRHGRVMIRQPLGVIGGTSEDIKRQMKEWKEQKDSVIRLFSEHSGRDKSEIVKDFDREHYMSAQEAIEYGLADHIVGDERAEEKKETR